MSRVARWLAFSAGLYTSVAAAGECTRPTDAGGVNGYDYGTATVHAFSTSQVVVWYVLSGPHAVNPASTRQDGIPDDVAEVAAVTSDALVRYAAMGFRAPVSDAQNPACGSNGGDGRFDVYLVQMTGADGTTVTEAGRCAQVGSDIGTACATFVLAKSDFAESYQSSSIGIRTVLPHETFHAVQDAYDVALDRFWAEGTAQWAAKTLDPSLLDLEKFLPAFFGASGRSLDAPPSGVTSGFLYGAAIWPVFLTSRFSNDIVRAIFEREARAGGKALDATDVALQAQQSSLAGAYPQFAAWNAATGARAGTGGYENAAHYPLIDLTELSSSGTQGTTSGLASFYYHVKTDAKMQVALRTDAARNTGMLVPLADGVAHVDEAVALPAELWGEGIVIVSGITTNKSDAPFIVTLAPSADAGGCALANRSGSTGSWSLLLFAALALLPLRRVRRRAVQRAR